MKKSLWVFLFMALTGSACFSQYKLDLKTRFAHKFEMKGIKHGMTFFLEHAGHRIVEFGEDYCVWLERIEERQVAPDRYELAMRIRITRPSLLGDRPTLASRDFTFTYDFEPQILSTDEPFWAFIREQVRDIEKKDEIRAFRVGKRVANEVVAMLE